MSWHVAVMEVRPCWLEGMGVTYNLSKSFRKVNGDRSLDEWLNGRECLETVSDLADAVIKLRTPDPEDKRAAGVLTEILGWAVDHPDAQWEIE